MDESSAVWMEGCSVRSVTDVLLVISQREKTQLGRKNMYGTFRQQQSSQISFIEKNITAIYDAKQQCNATIYKDLQNKMFIFYFLIMFFFSL